MTRLIRLNEVQYAETEHQIAGLVAQGFREEDLPAAPVEENPPDPAPENSETENPAPAPHSKSSGKKGGK